MIFRTLEHLREQPEHVRRQAAIICSVIIMGIILGVWTFTLSGKTPAVSKEEPAHTSPFAVLKEQGKVFYDSAVDSVSSAREVFNQGALPTLPAAALLSDGEATGILGATSTPSVEAPSTTEKSRE